MWYLLALSLFTLQVNKNLSVFLLMVSTAVAGYTHVLDGKALTLLIILAILAVIYCKLGIKSKIISIMLEIILLLTSVGLMMHVVPGFYNQKILDNVRAGPESASFSMYYNFDKAIIPFILLICMKSLFTHNTQPYKRNGYWLLLIIAVPTLLIVAVIMGGLKVEFHHPEWLLSFIFANIFFVSLPEEALFRGYLQQRLSSVMPPVLALFITSFLFGALHYAGGNMLIIFATLAGFIYGLAWMLSGRLWVAVLFHAGLNLCHLLFFTYPLFQRIPY